MDVQNILESLEGKVWDTNGNVSRVTYPEWYYPYSGQCVSLCKAYFKILYDIPLNFGNAIDYYDNMHTNGILNYCDWITSDPQDGDIAISHCWILDDDGVWKDFGHVMIRWRGGYLSQNVSNDPVARWYPDWWTESVFGWYRPKINVLKNLINEGDEEMRFTFSIDNDKNYYFDGYQIREIKNKDEFTVLKNVYKLCTGKELEHVEWYSRAPWYIRLMEVTQREPITLEDL